MTKFSFRANYTVLASYSSQAYKSGLTFLTGGYNAVLQKFLTALLRASAACYKHYFVAKELLHLVAYKFLHGHHWAWQE